MTCRRLAALVLVLAALLAGCRPAAPRESPPPVEGDLAVGFVDVGDGDGAVLLLPDGRAVVVDTGPKKGYDALMQALVNHGVTRIEALFISHGHKDHAGNLAALLGYFDVGAVYAGPLLDDEQKALLTSAAPGWTVLRTGQRFQVGALRVEVLSPGGLTYAKENDNSAVLRLVWGQTAFLFPGDAGAPAEQAMLSAGVNLSARVLKAGHHGEDDATTRAFLSAVSPDYVVVSGRGSEKEPRPAPAVVERVAAAGATLLVTGEQGSVWFMTDGQTLRQAAPEVAEEPAVPLVITAWDKKQDFVRLKNEGDTALDIGGYSLLSENGGEAFYFPAGASIGPGQEITVCGLERTVPADYIWDEKNIFSDKKQDAALLRNRQGRVLSRAG